MKWNAVEGWPRGLRHLLGKQANGNVSQVRILSLLPNSEIKIRNKKAKIFGLGFFASEQKTQDRGVTV